MSTREIINLAEKHLIRNVDRYELAFVRGSGLKLWDAEGHEYLDFLAGIAVCALGHTHPAVTRAITEQATRLIHVSNYFYNEPMVQLAALLTESSGLDKAFFANSGAEANEAAIKLARKYSHDLYGPGRFGLITALGSFHGRTLATVSATGQAKVKESFEPLLPGFTHVPYGDLTALTEAVTNETCAIMLEPLQGEGGVVVPPPDYFPKVAQLCTKKNLLLILDEVQTGLGRTGRPFAFQHYGIKPHIISLAKALGGGVASGAILAQNDVAAHFTPGSHSTTVGGAPLAMAVGLAMCKIILNENFLNRIRQIGDYFQGRLETLARELGPKAVGVRGQGLLLGLELSETAGPVVAEMHRRGFIINATAGSVLRFAPPLIVTEAEIDLLIPALRKAVETICP
ncbi:MAG: acetylornithine aminotransferase [Candidatus Adiutrix intracellularis]|nr:MAG: acetylornithine aminotransferase [Candidatus Adiutrix intracellularis]MDR2826869.1 aspartate aminotransferase family protein [Candidatus Adiutrix intracellularis]